MNSIVLCFIFFVFLPLVVNNDGQRTLIFIRQKRQHNDQINGSLWPSFRPTAVV